MMSTLTAVVAVPLPKREKLKLENFVAPSHTKKSRNERAIWFDTQDLVNPNDGGSIFLRVIHSVYTGTVLYPVNFTAFAQLLPSTQLPIVSFSGIEEMQEFLNRTEVQHFQDLREKKLIIASYNKETLDLAQADGHPTCLRVYVDDAESLHNAIDLGRQHAFLMIRFKDPTNIPLELVIASLQYSGTVLIKEINAGADAEDAFVSLGVMEVGADGVMYSPKEHQDFEAFAEKISLGNDERLKLSPATIIRTEAVGMGYRSCIDLATLFKPDEGMIIGSTSHGGLLCCPEVFYLPYMDLRPFRVNAGAVHCYVYNSANTTNYMTELAAGSSVMITDLNGKTRKAAVGRMKTELRPLRLIIAEFADGTRINTLMQDDWHVRVYGVNGDPLNITELRAGDQVLAMQADPGRHVGIKITENIVEN